MKKTDIALIIFIASISAGVAYFVGTGIFGNLTQDGQKVQTVDLITSKVEDPDPDVFNDNSINPAVQVQVDGTENKPDSKK